MKFFAAKNLGISTYKRVALAITSLGTLAGVLNASTLITVPAIIVSALRGKEDIRRDGV